MGLIKYILGSDSRRSVKKLNKLALKVEELEPKYQAMSDEELKGQTKILNLESTEVKIFRTFPPFLLMVDSSILYSFSTYFLVFLFYSLSTCFFSYLHGKDVH